MKIPAEIEVAVEVARERRGLLEELRAALVEGDRARIDRAARRLVGLEEVGDEGDRPDPGLH